MARDGLRLERIGAAALFVALFGQLCFGALRDGLTIDEVVYIACGYRSLTTNNHAMNEGYPPLAPALGALPLLALDVRRVEPRTGETLWPWAYRFLHVENRATPLIMAARIPVIVITLALAFLVWRWTAALAGPAAGLVALGLYAFHPSLLAHGHLDTTDMPAAAAMALCSWAFWHWCRAPSARAAGLLGLALGLALATRLTGALMLPVIALLLAQHLYAATDRRAAARESLRLAAIAAPVAALTLLASYGFSSQAFSWYREAIRFQIEHNATGHPAFLLGRFSNTGWRSYFLVAFAVKNTPGFLGAVGLGVAGAWLSRKTGSWAHAAVPAAIVFLAASLGHIQIGERYILPVYPYLIVIAASGLAALRSRPWLAPALALLLPFHAVPALRSAERGLLTYFNALGGGPYGGHRVLIDSNLDWGQDLPRLARWMKENGVAKIQLGYHGSDDPERVGIVHEDLAGAHLYVPKPAAEPFRGVVVVSPNLLSGAYDWTRDPYRALRGFTPFAHVGALEVFKFPEPDTRR